MKAFLAGWERLTICARSSWKARSSGCAQDDDGRRDHGWVAPDHVDDRHGRRRHETDCRSHGWGMVRSTILTLIVVPVLYFVWHRRAMSSGSPIDTTFARPASSSSVPS